jgi:hypothetical protein
MRLAAAVFSLSFVLAACQFGEGGEGGEGPLMQPGSDCMSCHEHSSGENAWSAAGTVYAGSSDATGASGVTVQITDAAGKTVTLTSNAAGNFYSSAALALPFAKVSVTRNGTTTEMRSSPTSGSCNSCHNPSGNAHAHILAP